MIPTRTKRIETEVNPQMYEELKRLARQKRTSIAVLLREAAAQYTNQARLIEVKELNHEGDYILALKKSTNRICALLAKSIIDTSVLSHFIFDGLDEQGKEVFKAAYSKGVKRLRAQLTPDEKSVSEKLQN